MQETDNPGVLIWPPFLYGASVILIIALNWLWPLPLPFKSAIFWLGIALLSLGIALDAWGSLTFRKQGTNINPSRPSTALVKSGPFRFSRNPIYLAALLMFLGLSLVLNNGWGILAIIPLQLLMHYGVILREERYLKAKFGESYRLYCSAVRRYL